MGRIQLNFQASQNNCLHHRSQLRPTCACSPCFKPTLGAPAHRDARTEHMQELLQTLKSPLHWAAHVPDREEGPRASWPSPCHHRHFVLFPEAQGCSGHPLDGTTRHICGLWPHSPASSQVPSSVLL